MINIEATYNKSLILKEPKNFFKFNFINRKTNINPSVFLIGAQKSGTTTLLNHLVKHPSVLTPKRKEIYFFNNANFYAKGKNWYLKQFPSSKSKNKINIDGTANYFESIDAAERLKKYYPNAKIIILLRDPVLRAYSHYKMAVRLGFENLTFEDAICYETKRIEYSKTNYQHLFNHDYIFQRLGYKSKGNYSTFLEPWLENFPSENIKIIQSEYFFSNTQKVYDEVLNFINLQPFKLDSFDILQKGDENTIPKKVETELTTHYRSYNKELFKMLGKKYDWKQ